LNKQQRPSELNRLHGIVVNNQGVIVMGSKDKRKESKGKKPQPKPVPAGK
jgi:hypothetical protein